MFATIEAKLIALAAILLLIVGAGLYVHHLGAESQKAIDQVQIDKLNATHADDQMLIRADDATIASINVQAAQNKADADAASAKAAKAAAAAAANKAALDKANATWAARFKAAQQSAGCQTLQEDLCPSVLGY